MARLPRLSVAGWPHVLIHRGHNRQPVFLDDDDRRQFRQMLTEAVRAHAVAVHAYGWSDSEVRLLVTPAEADALSRLMQALGRRYGAYFNRRHARTGGLWDGRFRATVIDPEQHLLLCMRFVESAAPEGSEWCSVPHHLGRRADPLITNHPRYWAIGNTPFEREAAYAKQVQQPLGLDLSQQVEEAALKGWPLGSPKFVVLLQDKTARRLAPRPRGRPPAPAKEKTVPN
jgi:putative transposase